MTKNKERGNSELHFLKRIWAIISNSLLIGQYSKSGEKDGD